VLMQEHGEYEENEGHANDMYGNCVLLSFLGCLLLACQHACLWGCGFPPIEYFVWA
jgi:hypothetical protein